MLSVKGLMAIAKERTGLTNFGDDYFQATLDRLCESINRESAMSDFGKVAFPEVLVHALCNRLEIEDWYARHPEIAEQEIVAPLFIVGMPRTGSTLLSYQLSLDPLTRSFRLWESEKPCPPPIKGQDKDDPRIAEANARHNAFVAAMPAIALMTPYDPRGPVECYELFYLTFHYAHYDMYVHCPSYVEWFMDPAHDHTPAYRYHQRVLKLLQWRCPPTRWCLKMPSHSLMIKGLNAVYPDARFVMTHRDPAKVVVSATHLNVTVRELFNVDPMKQYFGQHSIALWDTALKRLLDFRARNEARFFDIFHHDQLIDPMPDLIKLYKWLGWPLTDAYLAQVKAWRRDNPKADNPYNAADFGLDLAKLRERFSFYTSRFPRIALG